jgi:hypothetical protein
MNPLDLKGTSTTPAILFNVDKLTIKGRSIPLSEAKFYDPYISWAGLLKSEKLTVDINLEYMNSSSSKKLLLLLKALDSNTEIKTLKINWYYENGDDEAKESGKVFENLLRKAEFKFVKVM